MGALLTVYPGTAANAPERRAQPPERQGRRSDPATLARAVETRLGAVRGLTARFTQTLESVALPSAQREEGIVYLQRPGRMRWEYREPAGKLAVVDGERSWLYLPEDRQVLVTPIAGLGRDQGVGLLLADRLDLLAEFEPVWGEARGEGGVRPLVLRPRAPAGAYDRLAIEPDATGFPTSITIFDPLGGSVTYRFTDLRFVETLDPALFRFVPPAGVAVQDLDP